jgi:hypothetical protein
MRNETWRLIVCIAATVFAVAILLAVGFATNH